MKKLHGPGVAPHGAHGYFDLLTLSRAASAGYAT